MRTILVRVSNIALIVTLGLFFTTACSKKQTGGGQLSGNVIVDGSSTVFPITEAVAEEFGKVYPRVRVTVGVSGTGGGFKKFILGETDINDASRTIKDGEIAKAVANNVDYIEIPVAYDGISIVINPKNTWATSITTAELKKIWNRGSTVKTWKDVRPTWPNTELKLYGPGTDSGTFDYFTEAINGKSHVSRSGYTKSEDDNVLVKGVAGDVGAMGYFGFAYYKENKALVKALPVDNGKGPVSPSMKTINDGSYAPLSRPIYIYVSKKSVSEKKHVREFVNYYINNAPSLAEEVGYVSMPQDKYTSSLKLMNNIPSNAR